MSFKDLPVGKKIAVAFTIISAAVIALGIFLISELQSVRDSVLVLTDETIPSVLLVDKIELESTAIRQDQYAYIANIDSQEVPAWVKDSRSMIKAVTALLDKYEPTIVTEEERQSFLSVRKTWNTVQQSQSGFLEFIQQRNADSANKILRESWDEFKEFKKALADLVRVNDNFIKDDRTVTLDRVANATLLTRIGIACIILFMILMNLFLAKQIRNPLNEVIKMAGEIASGNLTYTLKRDQIGNDELGELADSCENMQSNLRALIEEVNSAVMQLGAAIEEVSAISEQSTQGMNMQHNSITTVATAMEQVQMSVNEVAKNTEDASLSAADATKDASMGNQEIQQNITAIQQVSEVIENAGQIVEQLEENTTSIGMVVDVIGGIAEQTNLLALNAAIEAARAGEQGRGFAVVADEVRTLAGRTQDSTREITDIIEKLQIRANEAGAATQQSRDMIRGCVEQSMATGEKITAIEGAINQIAAMSTQIASACSEQTSVTEELNRNVAGINSACSEVTSGAQHTAQACIELSRLSVGLQSSIRSFKTE